MSIAVEVSNLTKRFRKRIAEENRPRPGSPPGPSPSRSSQRLSPARTPGLPLPRRLRPRRRFTTVEAVRDISFTIEQGESLAFIGPNGAGKSTTIKLITGILHPDSGSISVSGLDPHRERKKLALNIGTVFGQKSQLWYHLSARDSLELLGAVYHLDNTSCRKRIADLAEILEIGDLLDQPVRKLSLGQRIRCEIAGSLIHSPSIVFLDEPSIGLDIIAKQKLRGFIRRINREEGVTVFLTSHDADDIEHICRRVIVINRGTVVSDGSVNTMKYHLLGRRILDIELQETPNAQERAKRTAQEIKAMNLPGLRRQPRFPDSDSHRRLHPLQPLRRPPAQLLALTPLRPAAPASGTGPEPGPIHHHRPHRLLAGRIHPHRLDRSKTQLHSRRPSHPHRFLPPSPGPNQQTEPLRLLHLLACKNYG